MLPAHMLGFKDEIMTLSFNAKRVKKNGEVPPFGGKRVIFVGDLAQLPPMDGQPFYRLTNTALYTKGTSGLKAGRSKQGRIIYRKYTRPNVTICEKSHRNIGLLAEIANALREGKQTLEHQNMLEMQFRRFPDAVYDRGIHYYIETAMMCNWCSL
jgi:hypothetical protein